MYPLSDWQEEQSRTLYLGHSLPDPPPCLSVLFCEAILLGFPQHQTYLPRMCLWIPASFVCRVVFTHGAWLV